MENKKEIYKETVERYCHIIGKNTTFNSYMQGSDRCFECLNREECQKNGGCKHHLFSKNNTSKKEG